MEEATARGEQSLPKELWGLIIESALPPHGRFPVCTEEKFTTFLQMKYLCRFMLVNHDWNEIAWSKMTGIAFTSKKEFERWKLDNLFPAPYVVDVIFPHAAQHITALLTNVKLSPELCNNFSQMCPNLTSLFVRIEDEDEEEDSDDGEEDNNSGKKKNVEEKEMNPLVKMLQQQRPHNEISPWQSSLKKLGMISKDEELATVCEGPNKLLNLQLLLVSDSDSTLSDHAAGYYIPMLTNLTSLYLEDCPNVEKTTFMKIFASCTSLTSLLLDELTTNDPLDALVLSPITHNLKVINLTTAT